MRSKFVIPALAALMAFPASAQELKTAVDGTFAPHAFPNLSGGTQGFNIDLFNEVAKRMGRKITITSTQWSGILPSLQAGQIDFVAAPTTVTEARAENMLFTEGYLNTDFQALIKKGGKKFEKPEDMKGLVLAVNKGSAYDSWARELAPKIGWTVESFGTQSDAVQAVLSGRAAATVAGNTSVAWAAKTNPQLELSFLVSTGKVFASPLRLDSAELRVELENALECIKLDGTMATLHEKWFGTKPAPESAAVTVYPGTGVPGLKGYDETPREPKCG
jgi:polar amino acid transport system substrate-binding protein